MAANMMEILERIQRDLENVHKNLSEKLNIMEEKVCDLPQLRETIEKLEQQVKKTENNLEDRTHVPYKTDRGGNKADHLVDPSEKCIENTEGTQLPTSCKVSNIQETEFNNKETKKEDNFQRTGKYRDEAGELITNEIREIKKMMKDFIEIRHTSVEEAASCNRHDATGMSPTNLVIDQVSKLDDKLNNVTNVYESHMREIKELIKDSKATSKKSYEETSKTLLKQVTAQEASISFSVEQICQLSDKLKLITDITQCKTTEIKDLIQTNQSALREIKDLVKKTPVEGASSTVREQKIVKISPTYFSPDQLSKLNSKLKQVAETYKKTNIFPIVEVIPGAAERHPVMELLSKGVYYKDIKADLYDFIVKFGVDGLKRSDVIDMITDNPDLSIKDVVREWLKATNVWDVRIKTHNFHFPKHLSNGQLVDINE